MRPKPLNRLRRAESELRARFASRSRAIHDREPIPGSRSPGPRRASARCPCRTRIIEGGGGFNSLLFTYARTLVRAAAERAKPNDERLREYTDGALPRIEQMLRADVPVYPDLEELTLSFSLARMREFLGPDYPLVQPAAGPGLPGYS